jgi:hypothetical protein
VDSHGEQSRFGRVHWEFTASEDDMEPNSQGQQDEQVPAVDGDDVLEQASGGKGVVRNGFSLD